MDFKQFAERMVSFLEESRLSKMYNQMLATKIAPALCNYQCLLCEKTVQSDINPVYRDGWSCVKGNQYVCLQCARHVALLASIEQMCLNRGEIK